MQEAATVNDMSPSQEAGCLSGEKQTAPPFATRGRLQRQPQLRDELVHQKDRPREFHLKRILFPTDFSPASARAVESAISIANQYNAVLTILHVIDVNAQPAPGESGIAQDLMRHRWDDGSEQMGQLALSLCGRVQAGTMIEEGLPWETIAERSRDFDLVVLGKGGRPAGRKLFSQHTAQRVIENAACPVIVVPNGEGQG